MSPRVLFRTFAIAEVITWGGLIAALILRGTGVTEAAVAPAGGVHGFVFLAYCGVTVFVWVNQRWRPAVGLIGLASSVVPFATLPFEIVADRRGLLSGGWRLAPGGNQPHGPLERLQAQILRRPLAALLVFVVAVTAVFLVLLWLGPPVPRS